MNGSRGIGVVALLAMLAGGLLVGCSTPPEYATSPELGAANVHQDILAKADLKYYWQRRIPLPPDDRLKDIYLLGENLYFLTTKNVMICVDARVGNPRWSIQITKGGDEVFAPTHVDGMRLSKKRGGLDSVLNPPSLDSYPAFDAVLINTTTRLLVLDRKTGEVYRDMAFSRFSARNRGISDGQRFYVGASNRMIYAVKLMQGLNIWWQEIGDEIVKAPLALAERHIYVATMDGLLQSMVADDIGTKIWQVRLGGGVRTPFHADARGVFLAADDRMLYGRDVHRGTALWDPIALAGDPIGPVQIGEQTLFQEAGDGAGLYAVDLANGRLRWRNQLGAKVLAILDGTVYLQDRRRHLQIVDEMTGNVTTTLPLTGFQLVARNTTAPAIYAARHDGRIYCIRKADAPVLTVDDLTAP